MLKVTSIRIRIMPVCMHLVKSAYSRNQFSYFSTKTYEPRHEISNNVVCATSKASDQPAHTRSLIRAFASLLNIL